ncbi:MAG: mechanosensitive ion channel family protein [Candidatus Marinarcus sp.]|uniref:mechanosensitive ion channel family protein n=1 Tax=Candidatus Marinarcus sp. TaxID=3100987 RepID=UPI003AFFFB4E
MSFLNDPALQIPIAITIFIFFLFARKLFRIIIYSAIMKLVQKTKTTFDDEVLESLTKPMNFVFIIIGTHVALNYIQLPEEMKVFVYHGMKSLYAFVIFWGIFNVLTPFSKVIHGFTVKWGKEVSDDITNFITKSLKFIVISIGFVAIMHEWGYNISGFLASLGLVGMALALAAKDTAANLFGSLVIFSDKPFKIGDWIYTPNVEGIVEQIGIRSTKVRTFAQAIVTVPNAVLANSAILNWSRMGKRRIKMNIGLTYSTTAQQMQNILNQLREMLKQHSGIHQETIYIHFTDFNDSSLGIFCYFFTNTTQWGEYMQVREDVNLKVMQIVQNNGAAFAFPSQSIYIENSEKNTELN